MHTCTPIPNQPKPQLIPHADLAGQCSIVSPSVVGFNAQSMLSTGRHPSNPDATTPECNGLSQFNEDTALYLPGNLIS